MKHQPGCAQLGPVYTHLPRLCQVQGAEGRVSHIPAEVPGSTVYCQVCHSRCMFELR